MRALAGPYMAPPALVTPRATAATSRPSASEVAPALTDRADGLVRRSIARAVRGAAERWLSYNASGRSAAGCAPDAPVVRLVG